MIIRPHTFGFVPRPISICQIAHISPKPKSLLATVMNLTLYFVVHSKLQIDGVEFTNEFFVCSSR